MVHARRHAPLLCALRLVDFRVEHHSMCVPARRVVVLHSAVDPPAKLGVQRHGWLPRRVDVQVDAHDAAGAKQVLDRRAQDGLADAFAARMLSDN